MRIKLALLVVAVLAVVVTATATAMPVEASHHAPSRTSLEKKYLKLYWTVVRTSGRQAPGRNIVTRGFKTHGRVRPASRKELATSIRTFQRWLAPPRAAVAATDHPAYGQSPAYAGGKWAIPAYIVMCESHGDYNARNASGAYGAYQIMPGTAAAYNCSLATPGGQDQCAARIYASKGAAPWSCG